MSPRDSATAPAAAAESGRRTRSRLRRRRRLPAGLVVLFALCVTGGIFAAASGSSSAAEANQSQMIEQGRALFLQGCATCHGLEAQGSEQAPSLIGVGSAAVDFQVSTGRMPLAKPGPQAESRKPIYSQTQIDQLAAYVASLAPGPAAPTGAELDLSDADLALGGELFRTNCAQCHQAEGQGGALSYGKHAPYLGHADTKTIIEAARTGPENMPVFGPGQLDDQQLRSIAKYIHFVTAPKDPGGSPIGHYGPVPEGFVAIVIGLGVLVVATLWIGSRIS